MKTVKLDINIDTDPDNIDWLKRKAGKPQEPPTDKKASNA